MPSCLSCAQHTCCCPGAKFSSLHHKRLTSPRLAFPLKQPQGTSNPNTSPKEHTKNQRTAKPRNVPCDLLKVFVRLFILVLVLFFSYPQTGTPVTRAGGADVRPTKALLHFSSPKTRDRGAQRAYPGFAAGAATSTAVEATLLEADQE